MPDYVFTNKLDKAKFTVATTNENLILGSNIVLPQKNKSNFPAGNTRQYELDNMCVVIKKGFDIPAPEIRFALIVILHKRQLRPRVPDQPLPPNFKVGVDIPPTLFGDKTPQLVQSIRVIDAWEGRNFYKTQYFQAFVRPPAVFTTLTKLT